MKNKYLLAGIITLVLAVSLADFSEAALITFNSSEPTNNSATRDNWLAAVGIASPQYLVDFESGFSSGQNVSGQSGLFPGGLVFTDTTTDNSATLQSSSSFFGSSNPIGTLSLAHNEGSYLKLDFSSNPVDYVAFQDIDHTGTTGIVTFVDSTTTGISFETTDNNGNSAEFFGIYHNDMPLIASIELDASGDGEWGIDTIEYGSPVPLPGAIWLFGAGIASLFGIRARRK